MFAYYIVAHSISGVKTKVQTDVDILQSEQKRLGDRLDVEEGKYKVQ